MFQSDMHDSVTLNNLMPGQQAEIIRVGGTGLLRRRYMEMGLVRGEIIRAVRIAPLGDPVEYHVKGYQLSVRRRDAEHILVQIIESSGSE